MENNNQGYGKEAIRVRFDKAPADLFHYTALSLINGNDYTLYMKLLSLYNENYGYAFPTIEDLMLSLNRSRNSIINSKNNLTKHGLLETFKRPHKNNNCYRTIAPLDRQNLYNKYPKEVREFEERDERVRRRAASDLLRLHDFQDNDHNNEGP